MFLRSGVPLYPLFPARESAVFAPSLTPYLLPLLEQDLSATSAAPSILESSYGHILTQSTTDAATYSRWHLYGS